MHKDSSVTILIILYADWYEYMKESDSVLLKNK
jgi:hypothetical protein